MSWRRSNSRGRICEAICVSEPKGEVEAVRRGRRHRMTSAGSTGVQRKVAENEFFMVCLLPEYERGAGGRCAIVRGNETLLFETPSFVIIFPTFTAFCGRWRVSSHRIRHGFIEHRISGNVAFINLLKDGLHGICDLYLHALVKMTREK